ncbi:MAG: hypothetical protein PVI30_02660 [Myxococcales bacterium]|jgi:hypothetical protein
MLSPTLRLAALLAAALVCGCAGHSERTKAARTALDVGQPKRALAQLNEELDVESAEKLPAAIGGDQILLVLDRAMVLQALERFALSSRDLEAADKQVEVLDFSRSTLDDIGQYVFSDDTGPYRAPPYEKLLINTMGMLNYLARGDLNGARIEARRFATMQKFISEHEDQGASMQGPGSYLAGFTFEKSNRPSEALRYYDEALQFGRYQTLVDPVQRLAKRDSYRTPRLSELIGDEGLQTPDASDAPEDAAGEVLVVVNYGRVPAKIAKRVPIGLALTLAAAHMPPSSARKANYLAAQGLVTWVNYPTLGKPRGTYGVPEFFIDQRQLPLEGLLAVDVEARKAWKEVEGRVVASAITRMITRVVAGETTRRAAGGGVVGALLSLGTQATMTAVDTPDTRSWATLPARIAVGRLRVPPGKHVIRVRVRGIEKRQEVDVPPGGWVVVPLTVLR